MAGRRESYSGEDSPGSGGLGTPVASCERQFRDTALAGAETAEDEGWKAFAWKHNALRHSFISYRVAETQDVAKVSLEAGNSPQMIFQHYRELVTEKSAKEWFSIVPGGEGKVIEMRKAA
jgi:hypothetical protein